MHHHDRPSSTNSLTPVAWRTREQNLIHQPILSPQTLQHSSPSPHSTTTSTIARSDETSSENETSDSSRRRYARTNTLRSSRSVPALNENPVWSGDPCPVHGNFIAHTRRPHPPPAIFINGHNPYGTCHQLPTRIHPGNYAALRKAGSLFDVRMANNYRPGPHMLMPPPHPPNIPLSQLSNPTHISLSQLSTPQPLIGPLLEKKSIYGSENSFHAMLKANAMPMSGAVTPIAPPYATLPPMPPPHLLPPGMRPRPLVIPAGVEPLPVRDPSKPSNKSFFNSTTADNRHLDSKYNLQYENKYKQSFHCCKGPLPLIWFIISIVSMGVVLGVVLGSIYS